MYSHLKLRASTEQPGKIRMARRVPGLGKKRGNDARGGKDAADCFSAHVGDCRIRTNFSALCANFACVALNLDWLRDRSFVCL